MYGTVALTSRSIDDYGELLGPDVVAELREWADPLRGASVLNLNLAPFGTGVADLLSASVPLLNDLGLDCHWQVIRTSEVFGQVTTALYSALGGGGDEWNDEFSDIWLRYCRMNAELLTEPFDFVIVHDPQPVGIRAYLEAADSSRVRHWVWHCHSDLSHAQPEAWRQVRSQLDGYDAVVFPFEAFLPAPPPDRLRLIAPCIDPLGPRNMEIADSTVISLLRRYGIVPERPIIAQMSPMDEYADPLGAIDVYLLVREQVPGVQLVLVASPLSDEQSARDYLERVAARAAALPDVHVLAGPNEVGNFEINVVQRAATVILQRALTRGFATTIAEAQWKRRPVVGAPHPGILAQVTEGESGYLATTTDGLAARVVALLRDPDAAKRMGHAGHVSVQHRYLLPRYLSDTLRLLNDLEAGAVTAGGQGPGERRARRG